MNKAKILLIVIVLLLVIIFFPIKFEKLKDGGSYEYQTLVFKFTNIHQLNPVSQNEMYLTGIKLEIFGMEVMNSSENNLEERENMIETRKIVKIKDKEYSVILENNDTVQEFLKFFPLRIKMKELNGNEKYFYFNETLPTNTEDVKNIMAGDIMLYGNDCLVLFYKDFQTNYQYTKIGHLENSEELEQVLGEGEVEVIFEER